jgi:hypothetical protein
MERMASLAAKLVCTFALAVALSIGGGIFDGRRAEARSRIYCPPWPIYPACAIAVGVVTSIGVGLFGARSVAATPRAPCPPGQFYRASKKTCVQKSEAAGLAAGRRTSAQIPLPPIREHSVGAGTEEQTLDKGSTEVVSQPIETKASPNPKVEAQAFDHKSALEKVLELRRMRLVAPAELEDLVAFCRLALKTHGRAETPLAWAAGRNNLANALAILDEATKGMAGLEEAVALYREALEERTRERAPRDWATIQTNLAEVLTMIGLRKNTVQELAEAAALKREALDWAKRTGDEGVALMHLAEQLSDKDIARSALSRIDLALATIHDGDQGSPLGVYFEEQLPKARALVDQLSAPAEKEPASRARE